jgi:hypothetical protein
MVLLVPVVSGGSFSLRSWVFEGQDGEGARMSGYAGDAVGDVLAGFRSAVAAIEGWAAGAAAARLDLAGLEREVTVRGRELERLLLQAHLDLRAARERRLPRVTAADGSTRTRAEKGRSRQLATVVGPVTVTRIGYRAAGASIMYPADEQLSLPREKHSLGLRELAAIEAASGSFEQAAAAVARVTGARAGKRQVEQLARRAAADFESFCARPRRGVPGGGSVLVLEADGKGIKMRPDSLRPRAARKAARAAPKQQGRLSRGEVRTRKRMAEVGAVFEITPVPRTAEDILPGPGPATAGAAGAPRAQDKHLTASVAAGAAQVIGTVFAEADRRDPARRRTWIALADGNKDQIACIQAEAAARGIDVPVIIDLIHVTEYLWDAAWCFHPEASPEAARWVRAHARAILGGHAAQVAAAIGSQAAALPLPANKRKTAAKATRYLQAKAPYLGYATALAAGWPISTGVIEGACRHLVKDRMDITGARWSTPGAEAILKLRAIRANGDWDEYWHWHLRQEHQRTHRNHRTCYQLAA